MGSLKSCARSDNDDFTKTGLKNGSCSVVLSIVIPNSQDNRNCHIVTAVSSVAFQLHFEPHLLRNGWAACSIGWEDESSVVDVMMKQEKDGRPQFRAGLARFQRESIDGLMKSPAFTGGLSYDREPLSDNPYHGNLLVSSEATKTQRRLLPGVIATQYSEIIPRPEG